MKQLILAPVTMLALAGCSVPPVNGVVQTTPASAPAPAVAPVSPETTQQTAPAPRPEARTVEEFDTTTATERAEALATPPASSEQRLGETIGSLGSPTDPGIWIKTPLVSSVTEGRAEVASNGKSANIELRPADGEAGSGSQVSLAAMRLLGVSLTDLPKLVLYAR